MLYLKSFYIYFLSIKKIFIKSMKEIFFSTAIYNKILLSKLPSRFFFFPNPYLLSPLVNHKDILLKISPEDIKGLFHKENDKDKNINNFLWLNLIDRKNDSGIIQKIVKDWIKKNGNYKKETWSGNTINLRIISWISNGDIILGNTEKEFETIFLKCLMKQINFVRINFRHVNDEVKKISAISVIILSGLVFKEYYKNYELGQKE